MGTVLHMVHYAQLGNKKFLSAGVKASRQILLQILSEINPDKRNSCCYQTDESICLALSEKPTLRAHRRRLNQRSSYRYGKGVWYAKDFFILVSPDFTMAKDFHQVNKAIKDEVYYPERTRDVQDATASTINVGSDIKSDNLQLTKPIGFLSMYTCTPSTEN